ncbi:MAG: hypothetical protein ABIX01_13135 [Chitinophagaceae bacterium]
MKNSIVISLAIATTFLTGCGSGSTGGDTKTSGNNSTTETSSPKSDALYFDFTVDGKEMHIAADDISSSYDATKKDTTFKIFAGKAGDPTLLIIIPHNVAGPSSTPNGSPDFAMNITQGSVSLQNYPEKNYTTNSFNTVYPEMSVPTPGAVVVTNSELAGDEGRFITGTINVKTYGEKSHTDPKDTDHTITGKFRIKHEFKGNKF